jgi:CDP-diacylglycerol--glycerol-3-phosphate 3-phosphatidyltransferase
MLTRKIGEAGRWLLYKIVYLLAATRVHPNALTFFGLVVNTYAAVLFAQGHFRTAGGMMLFAGLFDMVDGRVARAQNRVTQFGAFFDSVIDRYSDLVLYLGLLVYYANVSRNRYAVLVGVAMAGSVMVSYTRARAESLIPSCKGGFFERPERIVLLIIGALADKMAPALWLLAIGPNLTVIHRIVHTWREAQRGNFVDIVPRLPQTEDKAESREERDSHDEPRQGRGGSAVEDQRKEETVEEHETVLRKSLAARSAQGQGG